MSKYANELAEYRAAKESLAQWDNQPGPAYEVTAAENRAVNAAIVLADAVDETERGQR